MPYIPLLFFSLSWSLLLYLSSQSLPLLFLSSLSSLSPSFPGDRSMLTASQRAEPVVSAPGESIIWARINTKGPYPGPATDSAGGDWLMSWPTATLGKNIQGSAHTHLACNTAQTLKCTNTLISRHSVICHSETNTYKCVCRLCMRRHSDTPEAMSMMWLNLSSTAQHVSHFSPTDFCLKTKFGLPQSLSLLPIPWFALQRPDYGPPYRVCII